MARDFDPYHKWLGIPLEQQPPNHYRLLGIGLFEEDPDVIAAAADQRMGHLRTYQMGEHADLSQRLLNEVAAARVCLLDPGRKAGYDAILRDELQEQAPVSKLAVPQIVTSAPSVTPRRRRPPWLVPGIATGFALVGAALLVAFLSSRTEDESLRLEGTTKPVASGRALPEGKRPTAVSEHPPEAEKASATMPPGSAQEQHAGVPAAKPAPAALVAEEQRRWAEKLGVPVEKTNSLGMQFVLIPPGEFDMGSTQDEVGQLAQEARERGLQGWYIGRLPGEAPKHRVRITRAFYLGKHEVTVGQFRQFAEASRYLTEAESRKKDARGFIPETIQLDYGPEYNWKNPGFAQDDDHPAVNLSWNDAAAFCRWLSSKEGSDYRLPTEAEWEYACRAGTTTRFSSGDAAETLRNVANLCDASCPLASVPGQPTVPWDDGYPFTAPVGRFRANAFGLCDMHGNAWEWCQDWYDEDYYERSPPEDPPGPESGRRKVSRGGSWYYATECARAANRFMQPPQTCNHFNGFRVALADAAFGVSKPKPTPVAKPREVVAPAEPARKQAPFGPQPEQSATQGRTPVPGRTEQEQGLAHFAALYGTEWDKARSPSEKQVLATKLLTESRRTRGTTPDDFVLLEKTRELATDAADASIALEAINELGARFEVDVLELKAAALADLSKAARMPDQRRSLVECALEVTDDALRSEDFGVAKQLGQLAQSVAVRLHDRDLSKHVVARSDEVTELSEAYEKAKVAMATLKENPDNPEANLSVGRYLCLMRGEWDKGLPHLAKGADVQLKAVAGQELLAPATKASDQIRLADAWWELAQARKPPDSSRLLSRAEYWYKEAERSARSALEKSKILSRLTKISEIKYPNPDQQLSRGDALPTGLWIDLLRHVRLDKDRMTGEWVQTAQGLAVAPGIHPRVALPVTIDGEYDLEVGFIRATGNADVNIFLPVGSSNCAMQFSMPIPGDGTVSGLGRVDGQFVRDNPTRRPHTLVNGQLYVATIRVRLEDELASIEVLLGGQPFLQWSGKQTSLSSGLAPGGGRPALGGYNTAVVFTGARLRLVSGEARLAELDSGVASGGAAQATPIVPLQQDTAVEPAATAGPSARSSSIVLTPDETTVCAVNQDSGSISLWDWKAGDRVREVAVGEEPRTLAVSPNGRVLYVTTQRAGTLSVVNLALGRCLQRIPIGGQPVGVVCSPDGKRAFVTQYAGDYIEGQYSPGAVAVVDLEAHEVAARIPVKPRPFALALSADGKTLYVTHYLNINSQGVVSEIDTDALAVRREIVLAEDEDVAGGRGGIFNALAGIAIHPGGARALVVGMHANSRRGRVLSGRPLSHKTTVQTATRVLDLQNGAELPHARIISSFSGQVVAVPAAVAFIGSGEHFINVYFASSDLKVLQYNEKGYAAERALLPLPHGPTGVAVTRDGRTALVLSRWDRSISQVEISDVRSPTVVKTVQATEEPWDPRRIRGAILFHGTRDPRMTAFRWMSCGVCHLEGGLVSDGLVWDLTVGDAPPKLSDTMDLVNTHGTAPPFFHRGIPDPVPALERFATIFQGGTGFLAEGQSGENDAAGGSAQPDASSPAAAEKQEAWAAILAYIDALRARPNPHMDGSLPRMEIREAARRGRAIFFDENVGCSRCHDGPRWTTSGDPQHDSVFPVGTGMNVDTPSLDHLWDTAPYLHDGRAQTLEEVFSKHNPQDMHGKTSHLTKQELSDLVCFLLAPYHEESPPAQAGDSP